MEITRDQNSQKCAHRKGSLWLEVFWWWICLFYHTSCCLFIPSFYTAGFQCVKFKHILSHSLVKQFCTVLRHMEVSDICYPFVHRSYQNRYTFFLYDRGL